MVMCCRGNWLGFRCVITHCALETYFGTPPLYNPKCQLCPLYQPRTVTSTCRYESRHNTRKSPRLRKRREAPLNRRFLGVVPREREGGESEREGESSDKQQHFSQKPLLPDSALYCGLGEQEATRTFTVLLSTFSRLVFIHSLLNAIAEVRSPIRHDTKLGLCGHLVANQEKAPSKDMYGASGIPELIPPSGPPRQPGPAGQFNPGHPQVNADGGGANPQRLGQRAPKLGQIGRTKKVDLDDEDLDDIMNNNGQCPVSLSPIS
ncbi:uncharacterized protein si:dkey-112a7.4 [Plectropomus leopardus]|uniref:uncharacterized protein si:dkey-112a7.4 n=1 Tax=Plectropomus leopardus TaxID=160734 RepID=UPI001C4CE093|nr:uncharacterized protein si:dkey-112a7.4 [Plectropomus leopardus]